MLTKLHNQLIAKISDFKSKGYIRDIIQNKKYTSIDTRKDYTPNEAFLKFVGDDKIFSNRHEDNEIMIKRNGNKYNHIIYIGTMKTARQHRQYILSYIII